VSCAAWVAYKRDQLVKKIAMARIAIAMAGALLFYLY
jgi:hypothetical protein